LLVPPGDAGRLAEALAGALGERWDHAYVLKYSEKFTWEAIAARVRNVYLSAIESPAGTREVRPAP
jgi:hypothetical protein